MGGLFTYEPNFILELLQIGSLQKGFEWTEECASAFQQLKEYLSRPSVMSRPEIDEVLFAYIVVAFQAVSLVLIWVDGGV